MAYIDLYTLIDDQTMQNRVKYALYVAARQAFGGAQATVQTKSWAGKVFHDSMTTPMRYIMILVTSSPAVIAAGASVLDSDLQAVVNSIVPQLISGEVS